MTEIGLKDADSHFQKVWTSGVGGGGAGIT